MKRILFSAMLLSCSMIGLAQIFDVTSIQKVNLPEGAAVYKTTISPKGDFLLISDLSKEGLQKLDLKTGEMQTVTTAKGSNFDAQISQDGKTVVFRETQIGKDNLRRVGLKSINLETGDVKTIVKPTRNLQGVEVSNNTVYAVDKGKLKTKALTKVKAKAERPILSVKYGQLMITRNGKTEILSPNGQAGASYLWPSLSPDGTKIVYYLATQGAYTCDVDGKNIKHIGSIRAPKWYDNNIVIGMNDQDNGFVVTSSELVAATADGTKKQVLTTDEHIALYPSASASSKKISFSTPNGETYIINVK